MDSPPKRKGRPLLVAASGLALVSYVGCHEYKPVGNLRGPERFAPPDTGAQDAATGEDSASQSAADRETDAGATNASDAPDAAAWSDAARPRDGGPRKEPTGLEVLTAPDPRVGPARFPPVGNLRAPSFPPGRDKPKPPPKP